ncbi:MAG: CBS domain-containing protein [Deltaproteobacteria bacterium]|nr:CBS domain-containing protein [Deltaproteobacteria bacterium]
MPYRKKVADLMIRLEDYPHIPYWYTLRQAMAIVREAAIKFEGTFEPRSVLVFDEKYHLLGILTLKDIIRGLTPKLLQGPVAKMQAAFDLDSTLSDLEADISGPKIKEASQTAVSEVMSPIKATVDAGDTLAKALFLMVKEDVSRMPVMAEEKVVGIIRLSDLFQEISGFVLSD